MGLHRTALLLAVSHSSSNHTWTSLTSSSASSSDFYLGGSYYNGTGRRNSYIKNDFGKLHGNPNVLLGMAMLFVIATIVCLICYCCHRKTKMRTSLYMQQHHRWFEGDDVNNMEVYSVEQYFDITAAAAALERGDDSFPMRLNVNELPPSYHECIRTLTAKSQHNCLSLYEIQKLSKIDAIQASIDDDRLNNNNGNDDEDEVEEEEEHEGALMTEVNAGNNATTSTSDANGNFISSSSSDEDALDMINGKGVIKLDMSRIIDPTGLPTYEAALKLKSSSYI